MHLASEDSASRQGKGALRSAAIGATILLLAALGACDSGSTAGGGGGEGGEGTEAAVEPPENLLQSGVLTVGVDPTYPPYEYVEDDEFRGFDPELSVALTEAMGLDVEFVEARFASLIAGLDARKYDTIISAVYITAERAETVDFVPYFSAGSAFIVREDSDLQPQTHEDLCGRTVTVLQGSIHEEQVQGEISELCEGNIELTSFPTDAEAAQEVAAGRADVLYTDQSVGAFRAQELPELELTVANAELIDPAAVGIVVREDDEDMKRALTEALEHLQQEGTYDELLEKYALEPVEEALVDEALQGED